MPLSAIIVSYLATAVIFMMYAYLSAEEKENKHKAIAYPIVGLLWPFILSISIVYSILCFCSPRDKNRSEDKA